MHDAIVALMYKGLMPQNQGAPPQISQETVVIRPVTIKY